MSLAEPFRVSDPPHTILIVTVTKTEAQAVLNIFSASAQEPWTRKHIEDRLYYRLGVHGGSVVMMVQSEMGTATPGGSFLTISQAIKDLKPKAIMMCGIAFGVRPEEHKLGEILVSSQILCYELQKIASNRSPMPRGDRVTCSEALLRRFRSGVHDWNGPKPHFGLILSGEKLIKSERFRNQLIKLAPEAIGGEMEGTGLYLASRTRKVDWILVKAICDWADKGKDDSSQELAAENAAKFVLHIINLGNWGKADRKAASRSANTPSERKPKLISADELQDKFRKANDELKNYPSSIDGKYSIQRSEIDNILEWIASKETKSNFGMLIDKPGGGKTVVMAKVLQRLDDREIAVLAIKSDYLTEIRTASQLQKRLGLPASVEDCIKFLASAKLVVVLIDQVDALSASLSQDTATLDMIHRLLLRLINIGNVKILISCREFDLNFDPILSTLKHHRNQRFSLVPLTEEQIVETLKTVGITHKLSRRMFQLLSVPLHLRLFVEIYSQSDEAVGSEEVFSLQQLYEKLWEKRIDTSRVSKLNEVIYTLVETMEKQRRLTAPRGILDKDDYSTATAYLQSINLIRKEKGSYVFFHQTFFDYCYARHFVAEGKIISQKIFASPQGLFERSQMIQVLGYLRSSIFSAYLEEIRKLLFSVAPKLTTHLRILLIEWFGSIPDPHPEEYTIAKQFLKNSSDQANFLNSAQKNTGWFDSLNNGYIASVLRKLNTSNDQELHKLTKSYLASLISYRKHEILSLLSPYQSRSSSWDYLILYCLQHLEQWNDE